MKLSIVIRQTKNEIYSIIYSIFLLFSSELVSLFNGISTLFRLFNAKAILLEEQ